MCILFRLNYNYLELNQTSVGLDFSLSLPLYFFLWHFVQMRKFPGGLFNLVRKFNAILYGHVLDCPEVMAYLPTITANMFSVVSFIHW